MSLWVRDTETEIECERFAGETPVKAAQKEPVGRGSLRPGCESNPAKGEME